MITIGGKTESQQNDSLYEIRVKGGLNRHWMPWFDGMVISTSKEGETVITGRVNSQFALFQMLDEIFTLKSVLISLVKMDSLS